MRFRISLTIGLILAIALACTADAGELLTLSAERLTVGDVLHIEARDSAARRAFALYKDGEQINTGAETEAKHAAMKPQTSGDYTLVVTPEGQKSETVRFTVYDPLTVTMNMDYKSVRTGEPLKLTVQAMGGGDEKVYDFSVWRGTERIARDIGPDHRYQYSPLSEGTYMVSVTVTDELGNTASAVAEPVTVDTGTGIAVSGDLSPFLAQGGVRSVTVDSPGPWYAQSEQGSITLLNNCGDSGDALVFAMSATDIGQRSAVITLSSMGISRKVTFRQTDETAEEEEVRLFGSVSDWVKADGQTALSKLCEMHDEASYTVEISASGDWTAETQEKYVHAERNGDQLTIRVDRNDTEFFRSADVYVRCGEASAVIGIAQPGVTMAPAVREVLLNGDRGQAYQDAISARILTDAAAERVTVRIDQQDPIVFEKGFAETISDGLQWRISVPLTGAGAQSWLFCAENQYGSGKKALATISVAGEAPAFFGDPAETSSDMSQLSVLVTQSTERIAALDADGKTLRTYTVNDARVDRAVDVAGRYAQWTLPVSGKLPAALAIGEERLALSWPKAAEGNLSETEKPAFRLYSQMDGTWREKRYRKSTLEKSGCAIFALSHALQLMGHQEDESLPENLAITYAFCLVDGGTLNATLIGNAGKEFGYKTRYKLYTDKKEITRKFSQGAMFSFGIVQGHIALIDRLSEDGKMCHVIDSAPTATFSRIQGETPCRYDEKSGKYLPLSSPADIPGLLYYVDTEGYDGAEYWLSLDYVAERGVRLIQP